MVTREIEAKLKLSADDKTGKATASAARGLESVAKQAERTERAMKRAAAAQKAMAANVRNQSSEVRRLEAEVLRLQSIERLVSKREEVGSRASKRIAELSRKASAFSMMGSAAQLLPYAGAAGAGVVATQSFASFAENERALTRIAITADATDTAIKAAGVSLRGIANDVAMPIAEIRSGLDDMVASGKTLEESMALLPAVARTAQASGSAVSDIAVTATSIGDSFGIAAEKMEGAFDIMAMGGKLGKFELKDMAQYLPSLAPAFTALGYKGEESLGKLVAMLQVIRTQTGDASTAAVAMTNVLQKMETEETANKFDDFGINLRREMAKARREGKDLLEVFLDLSEQALKGDLSKIPQLFADQQFGLGMRALLMGRQMQKEIEAQLRNAAGTVAGDLGRVTDDALANLQRLKNGATEAGQALGGLMVSAGLLEQLQSATEMMTAISGALDDISKRSGGWLSGGDGKSLVGKINEGTGGMLNPIAADNEQVAGGGTGKPGDFYSSKLHQWAAEQRGALVDAAFGGLPVPVPSGRPDQGADGAPGALFAAHKDGRARVWRDDKVGPGRLPLPTGRPRGGAGASPASMAWSQIAVAGAPVDPASVAVLGGSGSGLIDPFSVINNPLLKQNGVEAANPLEPARRPRDITLHGTGGFGPGVGGAPAGYFVGEQPLAAVAKLPAAISAMLEDFGNLAVEADRFRALLDPNVPLGNDGKTPRQRLSPPTTAELIEAQMKPPPRPGFGPTTGDATLGSAGGFRGAAEIERMGDAADEAAGKLQKLPTAIDAGAFVAAAAASGQGFRTTLNTELDGALADVRARIDAIQRLMSFTASPTVNVQVNNKKAPAPVQADRGQSMSELGVP